MRTRCAFLVLLAGCGRAAEPPAEVPEEPKAAVEQPKEAEPAPEPEPAPSAEVDPLTLGPDASTSVGSPVEGHLEGSVALPLTGKGFQFGPNRSPDKRHGTVELVQAIVRAAGVVDDALPGGTLTLGDISLPEGGDIPGHASHRAGRDIDVMFYLLDEDGKPRRSKMIPLEPDGTGVDYQDLTTGDDDIKVRLDVPRTWKFFEALVTDENAHVNRIFVVEHLRNALLAHARKIKAPKAARERFGHLTCQPGFPHDDHAHIRFFCAPDDIEAGCLDNRPIYPWHEAHLRNAEVKYVLAGARKNPPKRKLTSVAKAAENTRERVGDFHPDVDAFLERRKAWAKKPHPGRKYCK